MSLLALRVISQRRSNSVAFGAKRTFSEPRLLNRIYEYAPAECGDFEDQNRSYFRENAAKRSL
jgi:hypothetical protein